MGFLELCGWLGVVGLTLFWQIRFLGDPSAKFTKALELDFDGTAIFGGPRGKRYALVVENGHVAAAYVEPDNIGTKGMSNPLSSPPFSPFPASLVGVCRFAIDSPG